MGTLLVYLLLSFVLSIGAVQAAGFLLMGVAGLLPGALGAYFALAAGIALGGAQFFCSGFLFALLSGLPWRRAGAWTLLGIGFFNLLCAGPGAISGAYFAAFASVGGAILLLVAAASSFYGCWFLEQREQRPWVEQSRQMILGFIKQ